MHPSRSTEQSKFLSDLQKEITFVTKLWNSLGDMEPCGDRPGQLFLCISEIMPACMALANESCSPIIRHLSSGKYKRLGTLLIIFDLKGTVNLLFWEMSLTGMLIFFNEHLQLKRTVGMFLITLQLRINKILNFVFYISISVISVQK